jgi:hypothetical protein
MASEERPLCWVCCGLCLDEHLYQLLLWLVSWLFLVSPTHFIIFITNQSQFMSFAKDWSEGLLFGDTCLSLSWKGVWFCLIQNPVVALFPCHVPAASMVFSLQAGSGYVQK